MKDDFDAMAFKHKVQQEVYDETKDLSDEELIEYFRKAGKEFERKIKKLRNKKAPDSRKRTKAITTPK